MNDATKESGLREAAQYLMERGQADVRIVHDDGRFVHVTNGRSDGVGKPLIVALRKTAAEPPKTHKFLTLDSLCGWLMGPFVKLDKTAVFVGEKAVHANAVYTDDEVKTGTVELVNAPEFTSLLKLTKGVSQKELWRLLVTELAGCMPAELLLTIGSLDRSMRGQDSADIHTTGLTSTRKTYEVEVVGKQGVSSTSIPVDYVYRGRICTAIPDTFDINLRLELGEAQNGSLMLIFHPVRMDQAMELMLTTVLEKVKHLLPEEAEVYLGTHN